MPFTRAGCAGRLLGLAGFGCFGGCYRIGLVCSSRAAAQQALHPAKQARRCRFSGWCSACCRGGCGTACRVGRLARWCGYRRRCFSTRSGLGGRCVRQHTFDDRRLLVGRLLRAAGEGGRVLHLIGHLVAGFDVVQTRVVVLQALQFVVGRLQRLVGHHQHVDALLELNLGDLGAFLVEQEGCDFDRHLTQHGGGVVLE